MYQNKDRLTCKLAIVMVLTMVAHVAYALPDDRQQIMNLHADSADLNQSTHRGVYTGNVELDQGSTHLRAAEAITEGNEKNKLMKAIAKGNKDAQAHYWALTEPNKPPLHAYADNIYYYPDEHKIELIGNARIEQGENSFSAPKIIYDTEKQHVLTQKEGSLRTTIIFHPEKHT